MSEESSNANVGESDIMFSNLALVPSKPSEPSSPCLATDSDIVLFNTVDPEVAVTVIEPLNGVVEFVIVTVSPESVVVICEGLVLDIV